MFVFEKKSLPELHFKNCLQTKWKLKIDYLELSNIDG